MFSREYMKGTFSHAYSAAICRSSQKLGQHKRAYRSSIMTAGLMHATLIRKHRALVEKLEVEPMSNRET
jgi:hypothetical protein